METNLKTSENVQVLTSVEFSDLLNQLPMSNAFLRDKRKDRYVWLKRVPVYIQNETPTISDLKAVWRCLYYKLWMTKAESEKLVLRDATTGNLFRNLDRFDIVMYYEGKIIFDTADFNLELVEGKIGLSPKLKVLERYNTNKELKTAAYLFADSGWDVLTLDAK